MTIVDFTAYHREYYYQRRARLIAYLGDSCARCESTDSLEFDHIDPDEKSFNISSNMTLSNEGVRAELGKCQLLCNPCHRRKTAGENSGWTHGTFYGWMKKKCTCEECGAARGAFYQSRNQRLREERARAVERGELARTVKKGAYGRPSKCGEKLHYVRGCRCAECRAANAAAERERKARKKAAV